MGVRSGQRASRGRPPIRSRWALGGVLGAAVLVVAGISARTYLKRQQETWWTVFPSLSIQGRVAAVEPLRAYRLEVDSTITARRAGEAVHVVLMAGDERRQDLFREPSVSWGDWLPDSLPGQGRQDRYAALDPARLLRGAVRGLGENRRAFLQEVSGHGGFGQYSVAAAAPEADLVAARFDLASPPVTDFFGLPHPRTRSIKDAAYAHVARAALAVAEGRFDDADRDVRAVISFGFVLVDNAVGLIDTLNGLVSIGVGARAMRELLILRGRDAEAVALSAVMERLTSRPAAGDEPFPVTFAEGVRGGYTALSDPETTRGLLWELVAVFAYLPCESVIELVGGRDEEYRRALQAARALLVRGESDARLFDLLLAGPGRVAVPGLSPCAAHR